LVVFIIMRERWKRREGELEVNQRGGVGKLLLFGKQGEGKKHLTRGGKER